MLKTLFAVGSASVMLFCGSAAIAQTKWDMPTGYPSGNFHTEIIRQFLVYVGQAARYRLDFRCHAEAQSHRVPGGGVRVLSHDKHFDAVERNGERA